MKKKDSEAKVTFVIPCFNSEAYLKECLVSIKNQTVEYWRAIVVNDQSPGRSLAKEIIDSLDDDRFQLLDHTLNKGLGASRNTGIAQSMTEWIIPLDSDDYINEKYVQNFFDKINLNPSLDVLMPAIQEFGSSRNLRAYSILTSKILTQFQWISGAGICMKKKVWEQSGGYSESTELRAGNEDWDFWLRAFLYNPQISYNHFSLYYYRIHPKNMSSGLRFKEYETRKYIYNNNGELIRKYNEDYFFLATGALISANAHHDNESFQKSLKYVGLALSYLIRALPRTRMRCWRLIFRALTPNLVIKVIRKVRSLRATRQFS